MLSKLGASTHVTVYFTTLQGSLQQELRRADRLESLHRARLHVRCPHNSAAVDQLLRQPGHHDLQQTGVGGQAVVPNHHNV